MKNLVKKRENMGKLHWNSRLRMMVKKYSVQLSFSVVTVCGIIMVDVGVGNYYLYYSSQLEDINTMTHFI